MQLSLLSILFAVVQCAVHNSFSLSDDEDINNSNMIETNDEDGSSQPWDEDGPPHHRNQFGSGTIYEGSGTTTVESITTTFDVYIPTQTTVVLSTFEVDELPSKKPVTPKPIETTVADISESENAKPEPRKPEGILTCLTNTDCQFWGAKYFLAALLGGAIVGFLIIGIVIIFICHTVKKRDQGTYVVKEKYTAGQAAPPSYQYGTQKGNEEFYA